ncbi:cytochrome P450 [Streptomyces aurantiogriseus]|uniref:Cytochrome P450 n=1 Tax=Streptomyces aurantiogriseus TaxID=66870 RepID=A0A918FPB5_9ACTN|nr:cytochrome P450 [Streptomyces aurantiogriseus]GGR63926.1 putative cytochrome P450 [Streptomyces aurantiogriseus]
MPTHAPQTTGPALLDLTDPQTFLDHDPHHMWRPYRTHHPVFWHPGRDGRPGFWVLSRYEDVMAAYRDNKRFTSEQGNVLATLLNGGDSASRKMLAVTDGPRHREIRNLMMKSFSPRVLEPVVTGVRERTRRLVARAVEQGDVDFVTDVADRIPIHTIGDLMGIPAADREQVVDWNAQTLSRYDADDSELESVLARNEIIHYISGLVAERRRNPGEDVLSTLAHAAVDGEPLSDEEIVLQSYSLILGGDESSRASAAGAVLAFTRHPDQWRRLSGGEVGLETAGEEVLRWTTPTMHFGRRALVDVTVRDRTIKAGEIVTLWNISANFDEHAFADPYAFDLARTPNKHVSFGHGPHFCLGAYLGRVHMKAMLEALRDMVADVELRGEPKRLFSNFGHGHSSMPVRLHARA